MNSPQISQREIDRLLATAKAIELVRDAQQLLVDHLNSYYDDKVMEDPLNRIMAALLALKMVRSK